MNIFLFLLFLTLFLQDVITSKGSKLEPMKPMSDPVVLTEYGPIKGLINTTVKGVHFKNFKGVPYAKQPVGDLRFKQLEPPEPWTNIYETKKHGPICMQPPGLISLMNPTGISEACIYANVYTPEHANPNSKLPVLVYLHGSGYYYGSGDADTLGPQNMVSEGVILAGVYGFMSLGIPEMPGNLGAKDFVFLLKWVQRNICAFGGDPDNVTIGGHSVGAVICHLLTFSPMADDSLFKRVILGSGNAFSSFVNIDTKRALKLAYEFAGILGIESKDPHDIFQQLKVMDSDTLQNASSQFSYNEAYDFIGFGSVIEKDFGDGNAFLTDEPEVLLKTGCFMDVPQFIGFTEDESIYLATLAVNFNLMDRLNKNQIRLLPEKVLFSNDTVLNKLEKTNLIMNEYFEDQEIGNETLINFLEYFTDVGFKYPHLKQAILQSLYMKSETFLSEFQYVGEHNLYSRFVGRIFSGAGHLDDTCYMFTAESQQEPIQPGTRDDIFSVGLTKLWANFIKCGNPQPSYDLPQWPAVAEDKLWYYQFNDQFQLGINPYPNLVEFYDKFYEIK